ncbi:MAG: hypothetical protein SGJ09_00785 [Phycisphaerae bacterium]|nr:hypothetical protein [Phycisphaerae bacterium]
MLHFKTTLVALTLAATISLPTAIAASGGNQSSIVSIGFQKKPKAKLEPTNTEVIVVTTIDKPDAPSVTPPDTNDGEGGIAEAAAALPFPFDFVVLSGLQQQAEQARLYIAGLGGRYNRAAYNAALLFLMHYEALVNYLALVDIDVPWAGTNDDATGSGVLKSGDTGLDSSDALPAAAD